MAMAHFSEYSEELRKIARRLNQNNWSPTEYKTLMSSWAMSHVNLLKTTNVSGTISVTITGQ
jgi:hypothetical protein